MALKLRRGTEAQRVITPEQGELLYVTDTKKVYVGDGATVGGILVGPVDASLYDLVSDTTPQLGGNLDLNGRDITGTGNININGTITATGSINLGNGTEDNINVGGLISSSLTPSVDDSFNLGTVSKQWANIWTTQANVDTTLSVGSRILKLNGGALDSNNVLWDAETDTLNAREIVGDLKGSVFSDDSATALVDATTGTFNGTVNTGDAVLGPSSIVTTTGSNFEIGSATSPLSLLLSLDSNLRSQYIVNPSNPTGYSTTVVSRGSLTAPQAVQPGDDLGGLIFRGHTNSSVSGIGGQLTVLVDPTASIVAGGGFVKSLIALSASSDTTQTEEDSLVLDSTGVVTSNAFNASKYFQLPVYSDDAARLAAIPSPAKGMMIFIETGTAPAATNQMQVYNGSAWVNAS